jgi:hypothetical protein
MTKVFDPTRPVQTRDGREARIICTDRKGRYPLICLVKEQDGTESCISNEVSGYSRDGHTSRFDLVNIPIKKEGWINVYPGRNGWAPVVGTQIHESAAMAKASATSDAIQTHFEWEE